MRNQGGRGWRALRGVLVLTLFGVGCAKNPPTINGSTLSNKRLIVTLKFRYAVNPNYYYFFLINNAGSETAPGPVPVVYPNPTYGNGFATGPAGQQGFTDYVLYNASRQAFPYQIYHVQYTSTQQGAFNFVNNGRPVDFTLPDMTVPDSAETLRFSIDLSQLIVNSTGSLSTDPQAANQARALRFLQVNVVATNIIPTDPTTPVDKQVDSFGDNRVSSSNYLIIDLSQLRIYSSDDTTSINVSEPSADDVITTGSSPQDPSLDLTGWTIQVVQQ